MLGVAIESDATYSHATTVSTDGVAKFNVCFTFFGAACIYKVQAWRLTW